MLLFTERLIILQISKKEASKCYENWGKGGSLEEYLPGFPLKNVDEMTQFCDDMSKKINNYSICLRKDKTPIGYVCLDIPCSEQKYGELGYVIGEKFRGKGYAYEAVNAVMRKGFGNDDLYIIEAKVAETNEASRGMLEKIGFSEETRLRKRFYNRKSDDRENIIVYSMTRDEYEKLGSVADARI